MKLGNIDKELNSTQAFNLAVDILNKSQGYIVIGTIHHGDDIVKHDLSIDGGRWGDLNMLKEYRRVIDETIKELEK